MLEFLKIVELNITELCTRTCVFCPRGSGYKNKPLHTPDEVIQKIIKHLQEINFKQLFWISGFGEPLLHKKIATYVKEIKQNVNCIVHINTNGDTLTRKLLVNLFESQLDMLYVSLYDGEHQVNEINNIAQEYASKLVFRHYYKPPEEDYGIPFINNRAGSSKNLPQIEQPLSKICAMPFHKLMIDWNGDYILCSNDWYRESNINKQKINIFNTSIKEFWTTNSTLNNIRNNLMEGNRIDSPCNKCNVRGDVEGMKGVEFYKKNSNNR